MNVCHVLVKWNAAYKKKTLIDWIMFELSQHICCSAVPVSEYRNFSIKIFSHQLWKYIKHNAIFLS